MIELMKNVPGALLVAMIVSAVGATVRHYSRKRHAKALETSFRDQVIEPGGIFYEARDLANQVLDQLDNGAVIGFKWRDSAATGLKRLVDSGQVPRQFDSRPAEAEVALLAGNAETLNTLVIKHLGKRIPVTDPLNQEIGEVAQTVADGARSFLHPMVP